MRGREHSASDRSNWGACSHPGYPLSRVERIRSPAHGMSACAPFRHSAAWTGAAKVLTLRCERQGARLGMRRREFIAGSAAICACTIWSPAVAASTWRIGQVFGGTPDIVAPSELVRALVGLGYVNGKDVQVQTRFVTPNPEAMK